MIYFVSILVTLSVLCGFLLWLRKVRKEKLIDSLELTLLLVRLPRLVKEGEDTTKKEIELSDQLIASLGYLKKPFVLEIAVHNVGENISFYIAVSASNALAVERQVQGIWNDARIERVHDYNVFHYKGAAAGAVITQRDDFSLPIRTYQELNVDTFAPILGGFAQINELAEGAALQIVVKPAGKKEKNKIESVIRLLKKGTLLKDAFRAPVITPKDVREALNPKSEERREKIIDDTAVKLLETKLNKPLFKVNVRVVASAPNTMTAESILDGLVGGFSQFGSPERNAFIIRKPKNLKQLFHQFIFRQFNSQSEMVLSSEELASIFHFPISGTSTPRITFVKSREAPPPDVPKEGIVLGESHYRSIRKEIRMTKEDRRRHLYVVGQTGTGKSVLLNNLSSQDISESEGVCVIDPNGDLIEDILGKIPKARSNDVILFDPSDLSRPLALNMLEYDPKYPEQKTFIVNEFINIFDTLYDLKTTGGPMFEQYMRYALLLLMDNPAHGYTLMEIPNLFSDSGFRKKLLAECKNLPTKEFWEKEAEKAGGEAALANITPYITSKFNNFIANDYVRPIIAQSKSTLNFREIMDTKKILLVNLSKGRIGNINANLLGMIIVGKLTVAAFSRTDIPMEERKDFYLYIDEFQNFVTPSIATILSEARKYRLSLTIAHQFIGQLPEEIRNAVFGNVGSMVVFRIGADDAEFLSKQFTPVFEESDLLNIDNLEAHVKLLIRSQATQPFNMRVPLPARGTSEVASVLRDLSRLQYGRNREEVESEIYSRHGI